MPITSIAAFSQPLQEVDATEDPNNSVITPQWLDSFLSGAPGASGHGATAAVPGDGGTAIFYSPPGTPLVNIEKPWQAGYPSQLAIPAAAAVGRPTISQGAGGADVGLTVIGLDASGNWTWAADFEQALPNSETDPTLWDWSDMGYTPNVATFSGEWSPSGAGMMASGLSIPGLATLQTEVAAGVIPHMIPVTVADLASGVRGCVYKPPVLPATRADGSMPTSTALVPRYGQLYSYAPATTMPSGLCPLAQMYWTAVKNYGLVLVNRDGAYVTLGLAEIPQAGATDHITAALDGVEPYAALPPSFWTGLQLMAAPTVWPRPTTSPTPPATPPAPTLTIDGVAITVAAVSGATSYTVYKNGSSFATLTAPGTVADSASAAGDTYAVSASNSAGSSAESPLVTVP